MLVAQTKSKESVAGTAVPGAALNADLTLMRGSFVGLVVAYSAAALVGAGAGVSALFVDWSGAGTEQ